MSSFSGETDEGLGRTCLGGLSETSGDVPREGRVEWLGDSSRGASACVQEESLCEGGRGRPASDPLRVGGRPTRHPVAEPLGNRASSIGNDEAAGACFSDVDSNLPSQDGDESGSEGMVFGSSRHAGPELEGSPDAMTPTWRRRMRRKRFGSLEAHARYLQHLFRRSRNVRPGCWSKGGMCGLLVYRPPTIFACRGGSALAGEKLFEAQRRRAREATAWYQNYVALLRRLRSGRTPTAVVGFCGQGGVSEGIRRANGAVHGQDLRDQPRYRRWFSDPTFSVGDSTDVSRLREIKKATGAFLCVHSPPCKEDSTARQRGVASEPSLITETRDALREVGGLRVIENVLGAGPKMSKESCLLRGAYFGLHVDRPRLFEANFKLEIDEALRVSGNELRKGTCLGFRRRWRRLDSFGRPVMKDCCSGNLWAVQGDKPLRCTVGECAKAMGLDEGHMDYAGMSQAIPPVYC